MQIGFVSQILLAVKIFWTIKKYPDMVSKVIQYYKVYNNKQIAKQQQQKTVFSPRIRFPKGRGNFPFSSLFLLLYLTPHF